jgi:hypothetical protein
MRLHPVQARGGVELDGGRGSEIADQTQLRVVAHTPRQGAVASQHLIIRIALVLQRVTSSPHHEVTSPASPLERAACEHARAAFGVIEALAIRYVAGADAVAALTT